MSKLASDKRMWLFRKNRASGFYRFSTAEEVTLGIDGTGLTAIVTGSSRGIGAETARVLALRGIHVVMAVNVVSEGIEVKDKILQDIPTAKVDVLELDLSSMASVRNFAAEYKSFGYPLNILINNAGVFATPFMLSKDNIELQFAINYLGHFLLTNLLLETMKETAHESGVQGRIVNISSEGHRLGYPQGIRFDKLNSPSGYTGWSAYCQSKLANILHANELTKILKGEGLEITANSVHPGEVTTNIYSHSTFWKYSSRILKFLMKDVAQGAATTCYVALHPQLKGISGGYFIDCNIAETNTFAQDSALAKKLWDFSMNLIAQ